MFFISFEMEIEMKRLPYMCLFLMLLLLVLLFSFSGCNTDLGSFLPGSNLPAGFRQSTSIILPDGITAEEITGDSSSMDSAFPATIVLENSTGAAVDVTFSAGSNFWCTNDAAQNLIIVYDYTITVPAGSNQSGTLPSYCLNSLLAAPDEQDGYVLGTVYTDGCIGQIISILSGKDPSSFDYFTDIWTVQDAIWECLDNGSLSQTTLDALHALP